MTEENKVENEKISENAESSDIPLQDPKKEISANLLEEQIKESRKKFNKIPRNTAFAFTTHAKLTYQNRMRR